MSNEKSFDPDRFSELRIKARGNRSNTEFAKAVGITYQYMIALINRRRKNSPSVDVIKRISRASDSLEYGEGRGQCPSSIRDKVNSLPQGHFPEP